MKQLKDRKVFERAKKKKKDQKEQDREQTDRGRQTYRVKKKIKEVRLTKVNGLPTDWTVAYHYGI